MASHHEPITQTLDAVTYTSGGITILAMFAQNPQLIFGAIACIVSVLTFLASVYFQWRKDRREERESMRAAEVFEQVQEERRKLNIPVQIEKRKHGR